MSSLRERDELFPDLIGQGRSPSAVVVLPLAVEGRLFGAMSLSFPEEVEFGLERREMKIALARLASQSLARSQVFAKEQALRMRMTFLAEASEILSSSLDYHRHARGARAPLRSRPRRLVRNRHGRRERRDRAPRGCPPGPGEGALGEAAARALSAETGGLARRAAGSPLGPSGALPLDPGGASGRGDRRRPGAAPDHRRARAPVLDLRPAESPRPHAGSADLDRSGNAPSLHRCGPRARRRGRAQGGGRGRQRAPLQRGGERSQRGPGARARRRRRRSARPRQRRAALEPGRRHDHRRGRGSRGRKPCRRGRARLGLAHLARPAHAAGRARCWPGHRPARRRRGRALGRRLGSRLRRGDRLRAPGRDRRAGARADAQRLRRHRLARATNAAGRRVRSRPHPSSRGPRALRRGSGFVPRHDRVRVATPGEHRRPDPARRPARRRRRRAQHLGHATRPRWPPG